MQGKPGPRAAGHCPDRTAAPGQLARRGGSPPAARSWILEGHGRASGRRWGVVATTVRQHRMFIGGEWVDSASGETQAITSPATGEVLAEVPKATAEDVDRAVKAARKAFDETWFDSTPGERQRALLKLADLLEEHGEEIGRLEAENVGKVFS